VTKHQNFYVFRICKRHAYAKALLSNFNLACDTELAEWNYGRRRPQTTGNVTHHDRLSEELLMDHALPRGTMGPEMADCGLHRIEVQHRPRRPPVPALEPTTLGAIGIATLAAGGRIAAHRMGAARLARAAEWALLAACGLALASVAMPQAWTVTVLHAPPLEDPRLGGGIAVAIAALLSLLTLGPALVTAGAGMISVAPASAIGAAIAAAGVSFLGLRGGLPVTAVALGGAALAPALVSVVRLARAGGPWRPALLACGAALVAIGTALACCGARAGDVPVAKGAVIDTLGYVLAWRGAASGSGAIEVDVTNGRWQLVAHPVLPASAAAGVAHVAFGKLLDGPVGVLHGIDSAAAPRHPLVWLAKGDSVSVAGASLKFTQFRIEAGPPVRMYADVVVSRDGRSTTVSPAVHASEKGEQPIPVVVDGVGSIVVAGMDADHGRVALVIPGLAHDAVPVPAAAHVTLALRPGLELAWLGFAVGLLALLRLPRPSRT
jgi:hypothetical protein